jgi:hypothetical protein
MDHHQCVWPIFIDPSMNFCNWGAYKENVEK